uniref:Endonuclease/exonuclease/phosphatase domain-containing protein n=1 Tax=Chenopodium quinoa TaxID=63459 RepID=A0A803LRC5_CHEQI
MSLRTYSINHIDAWVRSKEYDEWRFTGVYGHPEEENKYRTRLLMEGLWDVSNKPWLVGGDFNLMLHSGKKQGGCDFCLEEASIFRNTVTACHLEDLGFIGHDFRWTNNRGGVENIQERLDRFLANRAWRDLFLGSFVTHLTKRRSDHLPILEMWLRDENCAEIILSAWEYGGDLCSKIAFTSARLSSWSREKFGDFVKELDACKAQMKFLMGEYQSEEVISQMRALDDRMDELEKREEMYWKQRSRQDWLKHEAATLRQSL